MELRDDGRDKGWSQRPSGKEEGEGGWQGEWKRGMAIGNPSVTVKIAPTIGRHVSVWSEKNEPFSLALALIISLRMNLFFMEL